MLRVFLAPSACGRGEIGRRTGLKIPRPYGCAGSSPAVRTILSVGLALTLVACDRRPDDIPVTVSAIGGTIHGGREPSLAGRMLSAATAQGLVRFDAAGGIEPALAERWIVTDGGRSFIFRLREAEWPDGTAVTSDQIVAALRRATQNAARNPLTPYLTAVDEIVAMTPQVIEIRLTRPRPDLLKLLAQPEFAIPAPRGNGGSGPFRIQRDTMGGVLLRPAFDPTVATDEDAGEPATEDHVRLIGERAAIAVTRFVRKKSDLVEGGGLDDWPMVALAGVPPTNIRTDAAAGLFGLAFVHRDGFLADPANRAAIALAIDRAALTAAFADGWTPTETILPEALDSGAPPAVPEWSSVPLNQRLAIVQARVAQWRQPIHLRIALQATPGGNLLWSQLRPMLTGAGFIPERVAPGEPADLRLIDAVAPYDSARWYLRGACQPCSATAADEIVAARDATSLRERAMRLARADAALARDVAFIPIARPLRWSLVAYRLRDWTPNARAIHPLNHLRRDPK